MPSLRRPGGALDFFRQRRIKWWTNSRSGDRKGAAPTRNLASSQVACVNFLLPLASVPGALAEALRAIDPDVVDVLPIVHEGRPSLVEFEWVGWREPLEGGRITRGWKQTSADALIVARTARGCRAYVFEWKHCEEYRYPKNKGLGESGDTRRRRYAARYSAPTSAFNGAAPLDEFLFEPHYQIMRLLLLADRMRDEGATETLRVDEARVVVACPVANIDYRNIVKTTPLARRFPQHDTVEEVIRATLKDRTRFAVAAQEDIVAKLRSSTIALRLSFWLDYHQMRYGW
jgi:hypothetical protein